MRTLIATGGSAHSELAVRLATHILNPEHLSHPPTVLTVIKQEADRPKAEAILARTLEILHPVLPTLETKVRIGDRSEEIIHEAKEGHFGLILMGKRPSHRLITRLLGSTATRVAEQAPCPVIVAKEQIGPIRRILLCDSGAQSSSLLKQFTQELAELSPKTIKVTILHVMSQMSAGPGVSSNQLQADAETLMQAHTPEGKMLTKDLQALEHVNVRPRPKVRHGLVVNEILKEARGGDYDLVVIGTYRRVGWPFFLLENLARQVIAEIDRPVLVVH